MVCVLFTLNWTASNFTAEKKGRNVSFKSVSSVFRLINADFCVAGCLIAYGAVLGKVSPVQLLVMTLFGVTLFAVEEYIILNLLHVSPIAALLGCQS